MKTTAIKDDASDLFGREPARDTRCPYCGLVAEPFLPDRSCWLCAHNGQRERCLLTVLHDAGDAPAVEKAVYTLRLKSH